MEIQDMVRLSGKSVLYLPPEYSPCALTLPTCVRATAQHIAQNATTRGIFRIPGSVKVVNYLYDYYCYAGNSGPNVSGTVCRATLPTHIPYSVHDVGSTFKRFLSVLPGGILGSLSVFDAFMGIHSQLHGQPEYPRTKQTKIRARLIALAIGTIESQFRRELICAVFGLLSLIGRVAEVSPHEDGDGRPLPSNDLMGYSALGIVFGPLLVGDLLDRYAMKLATPTSGLLLFPMSPKKQHRHRHKAKAAGGRTSGFPQVDKVMVAIDIAEMLIANWRDVVRQMKALGTHFRHDTASMRFKRGDVPSSASETFVVGAPVDSTIFSIHDSGDLVNRDCSPEPATPTKALRRGRSRSSRQVSGKHLLGQSSYSHLSPTLEEGKPERSCSSPDLFFTACTSAKGRTAEVIVRRATPVPGPLFHHHDEETTGSRRKGGAPLMHSCSCQEVSWLAHENATPGFTHSLSMGIIPPRISSRYTNHCDIISPIVPTFEAKQTPPGERSLVKGPREAKEHLQATKPFHRSIKSPLSDRLHDKRRAFENLLTRSAEKLRGSHSVYFTPPPEPWDPPDHVSKSASDLMKSVGSFKPTEQTTPHSKACRPTLEQTLQKSVKTPPTKCGHGPEKGNGEARSPDSTSLGPDGSQEGNHGKPPFQGKTPTKRRSVRALAAMFECQHDSPPMTRKSWAGVSNHAASLVEGMNQDRSTSSRVHNSPPKSSEPARALPDATGDAEVMDVAEKNGSPSSNRCTTTNMDDTQDLSGSSGQRTASPEMREQGTQTEAVDDEETLASMSSTTQ